MVSKFILITQTYYPSDKSAFLFQVFTPSKVVIQENRISTKEDISVIIVILQS